MSRESGIIRWTPFDTCLNTMFRMDGDSWLLEELPEDLQFFANLYATAPVEFYLDVAARHLPLSRASGLRRGLFRLRRSSSFRAVRCIRDIRTMISTSSPRLLGNVSNLTAEHLERWLLTNRSHEVCYAWIGRFAKAIHSLRRLCSDKSSAANRAATLRFPDDLRQRRPSDTFIHARSRDQVTAIVTKDDAFGHPPRDLQRTPRLRRPRSRLPGCEARSLRRRGSPPKPEYCGGRPPLRQHSWLIENTAQHHPPEGGHLRRCPGGRLPRLIKDVLP